MFWRCVKVVRCQTIWCAPLIAELHLSLLLTWLECQIADHLQTTFLHHQIVKHLLAFGCCLSGFPCFYCKPLSQCWCSLVTLTMLPPRPPQKQFPPVLTMFDRKQTATTTIHIAHSTEVQNLNTTSGVLYLLGGTQLCSFFFLKWNFWGWSSRRRRN